MHNMQPECQAISQESIFRWIWGCLVVVLATSSGGCWHRPHLTEPEPTQSHQGITVPILVPDGEIQKILQRHLSAWQARTGARLEWVDPGTSRADAVALRVFPPAELPALVEAGLLRPLPETITSSASEFRWWSILEPYREKLLAWNGQAYAVPIVAEAQVLVWRKDWFEQQSANFEKIHAKPLAMPNTWEEFAQIARYFTQQRQAPSLPPLPTDAAALDRLFHTRAACQARPALLQGQTARKETLEQSLNNLGYLYDLTTAEPLLDRPNFAEAVEWFQQLRDCRPVEPAADPVEAFRAGKAALAVVTLAELASLQRADSPVRQRLGIGPIPGSLRVYSAAEKRFVELPNRVNRMPYLGAAGWLIGLAPTSRQTEIALELLHELAGPQGVALEIIAATQWGAGFYRENHLEPANRPHWLGFSLDRAATEDLLTALRTNLPSSLANPALRLRIPGQARYLEAEVNELRTALSADPAMVPAATVMARIRQAWSSLDQSIPKEQRLRLHRLSVGLRQ